MTYPDGMTSLLLRLREQLLGDLLLIDDLSRHRIDHLDGLTVEFEDWWFNLRGSNTPPLLRLNVEADDKRILEEKTDEVLGLVRG